MLLKFIDIDKDKEKQLLCLFVERCKFKHTLCFLQYRKLLPYPALTDLTETFDNRKLFLINLISKMLLLTRSRA
jgi:hypothetical protein